MVYQWSMDPHGMADPKAIDRFWREQAQSSDQARLFFEFLVKGVSDNLPQIDKIIEETLINWRFDRVERVDLALLRVAAYEMVVWGETPSPVVINECVELAKKFCSADSPSFINGLLDAMRIKKESK